jgi:hypothetical protein
MRSALAILGADIPKGRGGFWEQYGDDLYSVAWEARRAYLGTIKSVGHDFDENKEKAQIVNGAYQFVKRKLKDRGVEL